MALIEAWGKPEDRQAYAQSPEAKCLDDPMAGLDLGAGTHASLSNAWSWCGICDQHIYVSVD